MNNIRNLYKVSFTLPVFVNWHNEEIGEKKVDVLVLAKDKLEAYNLINKKFGYRPNKVAVKLDLTESKCL